MGATVLPHCVISLPKTSPLSPPKQSLSFAVLSSLPTSPFNSNPTPISTVSSSSAFRTAILSPVVRLTKKSKSVRPNSSSEETEATVVETLEAETTEEEAEVAEVAEEEPKPPRKPIIKLGDIMGILNKRAVEASEKERPVPDIRTGDVVEITLEVPENRRRASKYKGIVMSKQNAGIHTTIRIRRIIAGIGVEIVFPVYSPNIKVLKVVSHRKVRRARLYYLRDKLPRLSTFK